MIKDNIDKNSDKILIVYHSKDFDGLCCGKILRDYFPNATMIGYDYGENIPVIPISVETIIMADVSFDNSIMNKLAKKYKFLLIDHHIGKYDDYNKYCEENKIDINFEYVFDNSMSACEGVWEYLHPNENIPKMIRLIGLYDIWIHNDKNFDWDKDILPFQYGLRCVCSSLGDFPDINDIDIDRCIENGKLILKYQSQQNLKYSKYSFECEIDAYRAICMNSNLSNSSIFEHIYDENKHDVMIAFYKVKNYWVFSVYSTKKEVKCFEIAQKRGGNGHLSAAGFQILSMVEMVSLMPANFLINL